MSAEHSLSREETLKDRPVYIMKFGGTSVGNSDAIEKVADIVKEASTEGVSLVVVVSAMSTITNRLLNLIQFVVEGKKTESEAVLRGIFSTHTTAVSQLHFKPTERVTLTNQLTPLFRSLHRDLYSAQIIEEVKDKILAYGERMSARIVAASLAGKGLETLAIDADLLIETDRRFGDAKPYLGKSKVKIRKQLGPMIKAGIIPVVTGFIGNTRDLQVTTLGRGGSDYTASILGYSLGAKEVWIWTDVDGVFTSDPKENVKAYKIEVMSYTEADALAKAGAKVLYSKTIEPLMSTNTTIRVKNTFNPKAPGTEIRPDIDNARKEIYSTDNDRVIYR